MAGKTRRAERIDALYDLQSKRPTGERLELLRVALLDAHVEVRAAAAFVAQLLDGRKRKLPEAKALLQTLLSATTDAELRVATAAAFAAGDLAGHSDEIVERGRSGLAGLGLRERLVGLSFVLRAPRLPAAFAPLLIAFIDSYPLCDERKLAVSALGQVRGAWREILPRLTAWRDDRELSSYAIEAVGKLDVPKGEKKQGIAPAFSDPKKILHEVRAMLDARAPAEELLASLEPLATRNERLRLAFLESVSTIAERRSSPAAIARLEALLDDRSERIACGAVDRLAWMYKDRPLARAALERAQGHATQRVRELAQKHFRGLEEYYKRG